jgi:hypothetical protein
VYDAINKNVVRGALTPNHSTGIGGPAAMNIYYVYQYLRSKDSDIAPAGTPYYIGKGKQQRAWDSKHTISLPSDKSLIVPVAEQLTESEAFELEKLLIEQWGRVDIGTGILRNKTNGGEGSSGLVRSKESNEKTSKSLTGRKRGRTKAFGKKRGPRSSPSKKRGPLSEDRKNSLSKILKGKKRKNPRSAEYREKQRQSQLGHPVTEEVRRKMSESAKLRWQRKKAEAMLLPNEHSVSEGSSNSFG